MTLDTPSRAIVDYTLSATYEMMPAERVHSVKRNLIDAIGCAAGGWSSPPANISRRVASVTHGTPGISVFGLAQHTSFELGVFANGCCVRYLDYNDILLSIFHPSDMVSALIAGAEVCGASGRDLICAIGAAYEVSGAIAAAVPLREKGWDQGLLCSVGTVAGLGLLLRLSPEQLANAIAIAVAPNIPLRVSRVGQLSMWKGCATAYASMAGAWATRLAAAGMTGPRRPFDGVDGLFEQVTGPFDLRLDSAPEDGHGAPERAMHKYFPVEECAQSPIRLMLELGEHHGIEEIDQIAVKTFELAWHEIGGGQGDQEEKWDPHSRETADHSLPYVMAVALSDGAVAMESFGLERVADPQLRPLMNRITVSPDEALTRRHRDHEEAPVIIDVRLRTGKSLTLTGPPFPRGHPANPMDDLEIEQKFSLMVKSVLEPRHQQELLERLWSLDRAGSMDAICGLIRRYGEGGEG